VLSINLSRVVHIQARLYSFEYAALLTETSITMVERFAALGLIEPVGLMRSRDIGRISQIQRLRRDLGLNLVRNSNGSGHGSGNCAAQGTVEGVPVTAALVVRLIY